MEGPKQRYYSTASSGNIDSLQIGTKISKSIKCQIWSSCLWVAYTSLLSISVLSTQLAATESISASQQQQPLVAALVGDAESDYLVGADNSTNWRPRSDSMRNMRDLPLAEKLSINASNAFEFLLKKKPYSKYWSVEQKWDDLFKRFMSVQGTFRQMMAKNFMRDLEYYSDIAISGQCEQDLRFIQSYLQANSRNTRWLAHMVDSTGKNEPGMLTGNLAHLGHVVQCIKVRAPRRPSNDSFDERYFEQQTAVLGERFRGKYCLASIRPVMPPKPKLVSRFTQLFNLSIISNISYTGEPASSLRSRARQLGVPAGVHQQIDRTHLRLDQIPFESELYEYLIMQRNFMYSLPRYMGVCYPSSCSREDIRTSLQKTQDDQHQVVDIEFECEQEEWSAWGWFSTPRLIAYVILILFVSVTLMSSVVRHILVDRLLIKRSRLAPNSRLGNLLASLELLSMDKCAGILFIKTKQASPYVDWTRIENNRSSSIDALKGFMALMLVYSQMTLLGCLPVPFMWSKWADAMFPFYRSMVTQVFLNASIWSEGFYLISGYLIALKLLENCRSPWTSQPNVISFLGKRYVRLLMPMIAFMLLNYVWPRLSNGFVMQDQANKILAPCDNFGWTNLLMFHNHNHLNETCLWPSHVSAAFFQLHLISYPILLLCLYSLRGSPSVTKKSPQRLTARLCAYAAFALMGLLILAGCLYPAWRASQQELIVPFLIDYIDFDNYRRVIEWTVLPTHNHLASYVTGLALAYLVVKRRVEWERRRVGSSSSSSSSSSSPAASSSSSADWSGHYINRENSFESVRSSSTQELSSNMMGVQQPPVLCLNKKDPQQQQQQPQPKPQPQPQPQLQSNHRLNKLNIYAPNHHTKSGSVDIQLAKHIDHDDHHHQVEKGNRNELDTRMGQESWLLGLVKSGLALASLLVVLVSSWLWNGLGQPMSSQQTFVFIAATKLSFCLIFAYLFHRHFATRRNANNPWMITRFLVPIGRMSLMLFYMSWLVIWFDVLSSPFQWHPSHYFMFEKYNEIMFMALVLSMFAYGAFEGTIKRIQYARRLERLAGDEADNNTAEPAMELPTTINKLRRRQQAKRFESLFHPIIMKVDDNNMNKPAVQRAPAESSTVRLQPQQQQQHPDQLNSMSKQLQPVFQSTLPAIAGATDQSSSPGTRHSTLAQARGGAAGSTTGGYLTTDVRHLSPADQYKLNAELRANYSFASIGLYESVGATGDLSQLTSDPQVSPAPSHQSQHHRRS